MSDPSNTAPIPPGHKRCSACRKVLPVDAFGANCQTPDGLMYYCRACNGAKQRAYRKANPAKSRESRQRYLDKVRARNREARRHEE